MGTEEDAEEGNWEGEKGAGKGWKIILRLIEGDFMYIKGEKVTRERNGALRNQRGYLCGDGKVLNECFSSLTEKDRRTGEFEAINGSVLRVVSITFEEVLNVLMCLKVDQSPMSDRIYPRKLWEAMRGNCRMRFELNMLCLY